MAIRNHGESYLRQPYRPFSPKLNPTSEASLYDHSSQSTSMKLGTNSSFSSDHVSPQTWSVREHGMKYNHTGFSKAMLLSWEMNLETESLLVATFN